MAKLIDVKIPDIGDYSDIPIIEIHVKVGDKVSAEQSLITLESDKASMDVPSPANGVVKDLKVKVGDKVSKDFLFLVLEGEEGVAEVKAPTPEKPKESAPIAQSAPPPQKPITPPVQVEVSHDSNGKSSHASPSVRKFARQLGVDVAKVKGTGPKGRITQEDVQNFVKSVMSGQTSTSSNTSGLNLLPWPSIDFSKFGETKRQPLSRIKKLSAANLSRNWIVIPSVTYHEDADITDLEKFRVDTNKQYEKEGIKLTMLSFIIKACVVALKKFPEFNSSLDGDDLVLKQYYHIGFAADTPNGLVVPVIKDADKKGIFEIAKEASELAKLARDGKIKSEQMQGACFTISSLGGIGGTYFSPIINAPEVAILGVSKAAIKPVWNGKEFLPRLICPLSLTADHRVIDGVLGTKFNVYLAELLSDFRRVVL
ncbi:MAG TPA: dihydrolipoyllysine-residue acetyltransferase [Leptospiraceae bacterium]|nr:dihydrolipoyllysine-residue acetyltransferase [Leptospiraceae bacterium]HMY33100.1 dihydrolipoyllysine-residue acetyltransferase [Leptospiraceae bacterium]HMZ64226.1 dihydrolipoyllysine-residue acetyltransferase [Leptospiraceae bacterium]HNA10327.1 dihydrolipoyllysine-residue acetyltransferase [Leptospiraceae bacterium]HNC58939.1 dihydrolipoyllysine-residue acetyltransferase [Leptospiraceae bacterium]